MDLSWKEKMHRWQAMALDGASFGFINALQLRHPLPSDFAGKWRDYVEYWRGRPIEEYYSIPGGFTAPGFPGSGRWSFPTPVTGDFAENNFTTLDLYPCRAGWTAPTMIIAHGLMSVSDVGYRRWARRLNESGWNAVFLHLPYHYARRPRWQWTGESAIGANFLRVAEGVRQAVVELRVVIRELQSRGGQLFGGWGTSYGGWVLGMLACADPALQRLILVEPMLNIGEAIWTSPAAMGLRVVLKRAGLTRADSEPHVRFCSPEMNAPLLPGKNVLLVAGTYDRIATPAHIRLLSKAWGGSHYAEFAQGHVGYTLMPESFRLAHELWPDDFRR